MSRIWDLRGPFFDRDRRNLHIGEQNAHTSEQEDGADRVVDQQALSKKEIGEDAC